MALPRCFWFFSKRPAAAYASCVAATAATRYSRVQMTWSAHSFRKLVLRDHAASLFIMFFLSVCHLKEERSRARRPFLVNLRSSSQDPLGFTSGCALPRKTHAAPFGNWPSLLRLARSPSVQVDRSLWDREGNNHVCDVHESYLSKDRAGRTYGKGGSLVYSDCWILKVTTPLVMFVIQTW